MMGKLFYTMPCLSTSKEFSKKEIYEDLFDKKVDKRYLETAIRRFIDLNCEMLNFLDIRVNIHGAGEHLSLSFDSSKYIGAIPIRMPYDGIVRKDLQIKPKFNKSSNVYSDLTQILSKLKYSIVPEYSDRQLCNPMQLKPPVYREAMRYIDLFESACRSSWRKFDIRDREYSYPKSSTNWQKYSISSADPRKALVFPARDSILTTNHEEWQKLKYVFNCACEIISATDTSISIRYQYQQKIRKLENKISNVKPKFTKLIAINSHDPKIITKLKEQANVLLKNESTECAAWRIDMAELFERYVQTIIVQAVRELSGEVYPNKKINGEGYIPPWGLKYLEPDITIRIGNNIYMADAKYKANYYVQSKESEILKETHRADLHQLLAYCSFEPQFSNKIGILFYPANRTNYRAINYSAGSFGGTTNKVILCGLAFGNDEMDTAYLQIKELFKNSVVN